MRKLSVFNQVSLDGYFTDMNGDISWAHKANQDAEWHTFPVVPILLTPYNIKGMFNGNSEKFYESVLKALGHSSY